MSSQLGGKSFSTSGDPDLDSKRSHRRGSPSSVLFICGNSTAKRISLLFVLLNMFALLKYFNLMSKTQPAITHGNQLESMMGGYQFHSSKRTIATERGSETQQLPSKATKTSDILTNNITNELLVDYSQQRRNDGNETENSGGRFAYAFLIGGALSKKKNTDHRGALYSVVVATHSLRRQGSKADVVLMVQISATTNATVLPEVEEKLLKAMNIRVLYLPKASHYRLESFYSLMMEKFRILQLEEYSRILYLDADILPMCNLDYMMELSQVGNVLRENVVMAYNGEPASGGFFVLQPNATDYKEIVDHILKTEKKYLQIGYPHWDPVEGWGHVIDKSDIWKSSKWKNGTNWTFYGAQADQGLLYYWTKYYKKSVSIVNNRNVEQWGKEHGTDNLHLISVETDILQDHVCSNFERDRYTHKAKTPYWNYLHFTGRGKPWYKNLTNLENSIRRKENQTTFDDYDNYEYWLWLLQDALQTTGLRDQISLDFITAKKKKPSLGRTPSFDQRAQYIRNKAKNGWKQYEYEGTVESQQSVVSANNSGNETSDTRKWAYAFLLGGARSENKLTENKAGLYSVVAAAQQLRRLGSRADIVLMVQIAAESRHETLTEYEEELLRKMNIKIVYIPKFATSKLECFYSLMMEKFRILKLTEYSRVMYLDYDVMPTCNLDYMFELSDPIIESVDTKSFRLKETVILAYQSEPSSGGMFLVKPNSTDYDDIQRIIHEKETRSWSKSFGWGHVITPPDYWIDVRGRKGTNWTWYGVEADQGLLYYWAKYVKKSVSIIAREDVEQWDSDNWEIGINGSLILQPLENGETDITTIVKKAFKSHGCPVTHFLPAPYNDFFHMTGRAKPWYQSLDQLQNPNCTDRHMRECKIQGVWYKSLEDALKSTNLLDGFSWDFVGSRKGATLGPGPANDQITFYIKEKKKRNWNQYREDTIL